MHAKLHLSQYKIFNVKTNTSDYTNSQVTPVAHISQQIQVQAIILWYAVHTELKKQTYFAHICQIHTNFMFLQSSGTNITKRPRSTKCQIVVKYKIQPDIVVEPSAEILLLPNDIIIKPCRHFPFSARPTLTCWIWFAFFQSI